MKNLRIGQILVLLCVTMDLVHPELPGVFSILHEGFFVQGVTRPCGDVADGDGVSDCGRTTPTALADGEAIERSEAAVARVFARDSRVRRPRALPGARWTAHVTAAAAPGSEDR